MSNLPRAYVRAFLASPGDLVAERQRARDVVDEVNKTLGRFFNIHIDLLGWEDTIPGTGRPQALINRDVDVCELFIGVLWRRWGSPTGEYSSGFEEEFHRAKERWRDTGAPEIWLAFKEVDADLLRDPGEHLQRVIAFRKDQEASRELLYKIFRDEEDWTRQLREWLTGYVSRLASERMEEALGRGAPEQATAPTHIEPTAARASGERVQLTPPQLAVLGGKLKDALGQPDVDTLRSTVATLNVAEVTRLLLFSKALAGAQGVGDPLSVTEANSVYSHREEFTLVPPEGDILLRTIVNDTLDLAPGWYWFQEQEEGVVDDLFHMVEVGVTPSDRSGALELLTASRLQPASSEQRSAVASALVDGDEDVQVSALKYLGVVGGDLAIEPLEQSAAKIGGKVAAAATSAHVEILGRLAPQKLVDQIVEGSIRPTSEASKLLEAHSHLVAGEALHRILASTDHPLRSFAANELLARAELKDAEAERLINDKRLPLREIGLRALIRKGQRYTPQHINSLLSPPTKSRSLLSAFTLHRDDTADEDGVLEELFRRYSVIELEAQLDYYGNAGPVAYRVLASEHFATQKDRIRRDLSDDFAGLRLESIARMRVEGRELAPSVLEILEKMDDFTRERFVAAALVGITERAEAEDIVFARRYLDRPQPKSDEATKVAISIVQRYGDHTDIDRLVATAFATMGEVTTSAVAAIAALDGPLGSRSMELLASDVSAVAVPTLRSISGLPFEQVRGVAYTKLVNPCPLDVRLAALAALVSSGTDADLEQLLKDYLREPAYYYIVACWLDRMLYSPAPIRAHFRENLLRSLGGTS